MGRREGGERAGGMRSQDREGGRSGSASGSGRPSREQESRALGGPKSSKAKGNEGFGKVWDGLGGFGRVWEDLGELGRVWEDLGGFGGTWGD